MRYTTLKENPKKRLTFQRSTLEQVKCMQSINSIDCLQLQLQSLLDELAQCGTLSIVSDVIKLSVQ